MWTAVTIFSFAALITFSIMAVYASLKKTGRILKNVFFVGICFIMIIFSIKMASQVNSKKANHVQKPLSAYEKSQVSLGEKGILNEDTFVSMGEDKENFNNMLAYITTNDEASLKRMMKLGKVLLANKGTGITLISKTFVRAKIEINSTGRIGWVPTVYISKE
jgi:arginine exporter protein ArgO